MTETVSRKADEFEGRSALDEIARRGAQEMLAAALTAERDAFLAKYDQVVDEDGHRQIVGNGYMPTRRIFTGAGPLASFRSPGDLGRASAWRLNWRNISRDVVSS